jgi:hypothetical protein
VVDGDSYTYTEDGQVSTEDHYSNGALISHNVFSKADKSTLVTKDRTPGSESKVDSTAPNGSEPTADSTPAPEDATTKL